MEPGVFDVQQAHAVISQDASTQDHGAAGKLQFKSTPLIISHLDFAVGMRLHFLIFAPEWEYLL
jgi:polysaccharide pyruvyl transferase WcaK-like protein